MENSDTDLIERKINAIHRSEHIIAFLIFLSKADREEIEDAATTLKLFVAETDPEYLVISETAHKALRRCLRQASKY